MGLFRVLMMLSKSLLLLYILGTSDSVTVVARKFSLSTTINDGGGGEANPPSSPPPPPPPVKPHMAPFKPSIAVVVGVLTTMFSITFLLLLYAKHCKRGSGYSNNSGRRLPPSADRKNSGVDRTVIESLPIFRFGSLRGEKDGLECAVCLNRFEPAEVLKLLPKCKHAFHVECVDTWLDAHSTCPLCRYRVDPEDVLLLGDAAKILGQNEPLPPPPPPPLESLRRVSGRHSSAGERGTNGGFLQIAIQKPDDSSRSRRGESATVDSGNTLPTRRSLDGWNLMRSAKKAEAVAVGCFDRRKDGMLLTSDEEWTSSERRRLEHRIIIGGGGGGRDGGGGGGGEGGGGTGFQHRWSDVQPSDLLYLRSEMIMSDSRRLSSSVSASGSRPSMSRHQLQQQQNINHDGLQSGRSVINGRSVSEITGLNRLSSSNSNTGNYGDNLHHRHGNNHRQRRRREERQAGVVSRWLAWISQSPHLSSQTQETQPAVRS